MTALLYAALSLAAQAEPTVLLADGFDGGPGVDRGVWETETHRQGRGQFGEMGEVGEDGVLRLSVSDDGEGGFAQELIKTREAYLPRPGHTLVFQARLRIPHAQEGIIHAFWMYEQSRRDGAMRSDEIDFEWLTTQTAGAKDDPVLVSSYIDWNVDERKYETLRDPVYGSHVGDSVKSGADTADWHIYTLTWRQGALDTFIEAEDGSQRRLVSYRGDLVPDGEMHLYLSSWVPPVDWTEAHDEDFQPRAEGEGVRSFPMEVDWVRVAELPD
ncbi:glycoside hydrolase family 16 protein [Parvularcula dongshanensis]|uniref:GH16 domain-containing protein n=1 Tax=Parvularcula dongshanensis TaxID=1173995 RepID=A0A840I0R7_9PROT|nr:glycoside hydrolase family 16 protein [Parvularcula dongshanensis]MBB4658656.1 hypothetical protein [Parvularcula dongshanensis]